MSWWDELWGIIDPGGNSADIRSAATAWQELDADLRQIASSLDPVAADLGLSWKGAAATSYQQAWSKFSAAVAEYAVNIGGPDGVPPPLNQYAAQLDNAHQEAEKLIETIEVSIAVGVGLAFFTFGLTAAAAEATAATAAAAGADTIADALDFALTAARIAIQAIAKIAVNIASRFVLGYTFAWAETSIDMLAYGEDPFNPANWSADLVAGLIVRGMVTAGVGVISANYIPIEDAMAANPAVANSVYFAVDGVLSTSLQQFAVDDNKVDASSLETIALNTLLSAGLGYAYGANYGNLPSAAAASSSAEDAPPSAEDPPGVSGKGAPAPAAAEDPPGVSGKGAPAPPSAEDPPGVSGKGAPAPAAAAEDPPAAGAKAAPAPAASAKDTDVEAPSAVSKALGKAQKFTGIGQRNLLRSTYRAPASIIQHYLTFTSPPATPELTSTAPALGQVPVPDVPPPPPAPTHVGGGTDTVNPGDTVGGISGQKLNNPADYPLLEHENPQTSPDGLIFPGEKLNVPELPTLPPGYTVHVIQPGDTVSGLAGGDPALIQEIARLNGLTDPSMIIAGEPIILPPGI
jgi:LysM repeat protein